MNIYKTYFVLAFVLGICGNVLAQNETSIFTNNSKLLDNPAFAGFEEGYLVSVDYKSQWKDFNSQYLLFSGAVTDRIGVGLSIGREAIFVQKKTSVFADFSYNIPINETDKLYFGIKAGGEFRSIDASDLKTYDEQGRIINDHLLQSYTDKFQPNIGVGIQYKSPQFFIGVGVPKLLTSKKVELDGLNRIVRLAEQFKISVLGGYFWHIDDEISLNPYIRYIYMNSQDQIEIATTFDYDHLFEIGISYRVSESVSAFTLINIPNTEFRLGYGYQMYTSGLSNYISGSHEFMIQYKF